MTYNEKVWFGVFAICALFWCLAIIILIGVAK